MSKSERKELGTKGRAHVLKNYNFETFEKQWVEVVDEIVQTHGSWKTRKNYKRWHLLEVA